MKIIEFHGGLGNQLFEYTYLAYLKKKFPHDKFYTYINKSRLNLHNGFELSKWFDIDLPPTSKTISILCFSLFQINRIFKRQNLLPLIGISDDTHLDENKILHEGWYQDKKYFNMVGAPKIKSDLDLGKANIRILDQINNSNSVAVHIRRGDYLLQKNSKSMGGICTPSYYDKALKRMKNIVHSPKFFFFSDDPEYVRQKYKNLDKIIVDCNQGERSFFDIHLMSHCKNMILSNSTFCCWAAYLNKNKGNIIAPPVWNRKNNPDLSLENWIVIDNKTLEL